MNPKLLALALMLAGLTASAPPTPSKGTKLCLTTK